MQGVVFKVALTSAVADVPILREHQNGSSANALTVQ